MKGNYTIKRPETEWEGLTLDEIRYARALTETRIMISREILGARLRNTVSGKALGSNARTIMGRMLGALSWLDVALIAVRFGSRLSGIFRRRR
jgi:hypothetical protein